MSPAVHLNISVKHLLCKQDIYIIEQLAAACSTNYQLSISIALDNRQAAS